MFVRKYKDGWYVCRRMYNVDLRRKFPKDKEFSNELQVMNYGDHYVIKVGHLIFPKSFAGSRIKLKVE